MSVGSYCGKKSRCNNFPALFIMYTNLHLGIFKIKQIMILTFHHRRCLPSGSVWSFRYHSTTARVHHFFKTLWHVHPSRAADFRTSWFSHYIYIYIYIYMYICMYVYANHNWYCTCLGSIKSTYALGTEARNRIIFKTFFF